jgi:protein involved in polysaccharide export with SLBB domain
MKSQKNKIADYQLILNHRQETYKLPIYGKFYVKSFIDLLGLDMSDVDGIATYISPLKDIVISDSYKNMQFYAEKYNTVTFRTPENNLIEVTISGAIEFPGTYTLNNNSSIEDLYQLVGGFKNQAFLEGIILTRELIRKRQLISIQKAKEDLNKMLIMMSQKGDNIGDTNTIQALSVSVDPENLGRLAGNFSPKSNAAINTILIDGDSIIVPKIPNSINVFGEVLNPLAFEYSQNLRVNTAINQAGGYQQYADKRRVYVIRANGIVERAHRNIFRRNLNINPGDTIIVPRKIITNNPSILALAPLTQILSDLAFSAAALDNLNSN